MPGLTRSPRTASTFGRPSRHPRTNATVERARSKVVYLPIDRQEQRRRVTNRSATNPDQTFHMTDVELAQWRSQFQAPDDEELHGSAIPPAPTGHQTWSSWASQRWPSLPDQYVAP